MSKPNRRRFRSHLTNHEVRLRLVLDDVIFALVAGLAAIGILVWISNREIGDSMWSAHFSIKETRELLNRGAITAGIVTFVAVVIFGFWSMLDAHRIAGPMHRLKNLLDSIATGDLTHEIQFRRRDEFQDVAQATDQMVEALAARIASVNEKLVQLEGSATDENTKRIATEIRSELAFFKLPGGVA